MPSNTATLRALQSAHDRALPLLMEAAKILAPDRAESFERLLAHLQDEGRETESCQRVAARIAIGLAYDAWEE